MLLSLTRCFADGAVLYWRDIWLWWYQLCRTPALHKLSMPILFQARESVKKLLSWQKFRLSLSTLSNYITEMPFFFSNWLERSSVVISIRFVLNSATAVLKVWSAIILNAFIAVQHYTANCRHMYFTKVLLLKVCYRFAMFLRKQLTYQICCWSSNFFSYSYCKVFAYYKAGFWFVKVK